MALQYDPNLSTAATYAAAGTIPPLAIDREWCLGDSLFFINKNNDITDNRITQLNSLVDTLSSLIQTQTTQINSLTSEVIQGVPVGTVQSLARKFAPTGWLVCDGSSIGTTGTVQGINASSLTSLRQMLINDSSPFGVTGANPKLPDLRGEFIRGFSGATLTTSARSDVDGSRLFGSSQTDEFKSHTHNVNNQTAEGPQWLGFSRNDLNPSAPNDGTAYVAGGIGNDRIFSIVNTGGPETRPRNVALLYCIKY